MNKSMKVLMGPLGFLSVIVLILSVSKRARKATSKTIKKGYSSLSAQSSGSSEKKVREGGHAEQANYPSYIGYGKSSVNQKVRKINPTRFKNTQNVFNDEKMPSKMAEIAEEFDLNDHQ
ncbi:hypothetical protein [Alkalihalobacillus sp. CinArs1]|uniref:hypothetical protein n=1 Tax=Alkalihalobacillus sp. CinArs1 TaxID=2995314 RepID=UPI0022DD9479|nr:hypothetical protein [Alkalihalobacillus sp. CinArs1]